MKKILIFCFSLLVFSAFSQENTAFTYAEFRGGYGRNIWLYDNFSGIEIKEPKPSILNVGNLSFQKHFVE